MSIPALPPSRGSGIPQLGLDAAITRFAIFLVVTISTKPDNVELDDAAAGQKSHKIAATAGGGRKAGTR